MEYDDDDTETEDNSEKSSLEKRFDQFEDEYLKFKSIPESDRLHPNPTLCGYLKVASLLKEGPGSFNVCAEHDVVYLAQEDDLKPLTNEDILYLKRCGIHYDSETQSLADFT